jgi:hypothetical protein
MANPQEVLARRLQDGLATAFGEALAAISWTDT